MKINPDKYARKIVSRILSDLNASWGLWEILETEEDKPEILFAIAKRLNDIREEYLNLLKAKWTTEKK